MKQDTTTGPPVVTFLTHFLGETEKTQVGYQLLLSSQALIYDIRSLFASADDQWTASNLKQKLKQIEAQLEVLRFSGRNSRVFQLVRGRGWGWGGRGISEAGFRNEAVGISRENRRLHEGRFGIKDQARKTG